MAPCAIPIKILKAIKADEPPATIKAAIYNAVIELSWQIDFNYNESGT